MRTRQDVINDLRRPLNIQFIATDSERLLRAVQKLNAVAEALAILLAETRPSSDD